MSHIFLITNVIIIIFNRYTQYLVLSKNPDSRTIFFLYRGQLFTSLFRMISEHIAGK